MAEHVVIFAVQTEPGVHTVVLQLDHTAALQDYDEPVDGLTWAQLGRCWSRLLGEARRRQRERERWGRR